MLCCCWKKTVEKKTITKPLLAESKTYSGEPKIVEPKIVAPKIIERKLTGFEPAPLPAPKPFITVAPKAEPILVKPEPVPEPESLPEPDSEPVEEPKISEPITIPSKHIIQPAIPQEQIPATFVEKNDFLPRNEKKRSKSGRR
jgi:hypothetical protein